jgi:polyphenol oxidase
MLVHSDPLFTIFFGDKRDCFDLQRALEIQAATILHENPFKKLITSLRLHNLIFLRQTHSNDGLLVTSKMQATSLIPFMCEGDFLVTNIPRIGLGIAAADCIPIVIFDKTRHVIAIVHAGWRGSVAQVAVKAIEKMREEFQVQLENVRIFMGPSAKGCCYVVRQNVLAEIERYSYYEKVMYKTQGKIYIDLPLFNCLLLEKYGVKKEAFHLTYNLCTICDFSFCSYRRNGPMQWRQMSIVTLK